MGPTLDSVQLFTVDSQCVRVRAEISHNICGLAVLQILRVTVQNEKDAHSRRGEGGRAENNVLSLPLTSHRVSLLAVIQPAGQWSSHWRASYTYSMFSSGYLQIQLATSHPACRRDGWLESFGWSFCQLPSSHPLCHAELIIQPAI